MTTKPVLGISGCLTGSAVRFDGGHKRMGFVMDELAQWVAFARYALKWLSACPRLVRRCAW